MCYKEWHYWQNNGRELQSESIMQSENLILLQRQVRLQDTFHCNKILFLTFLFAIPYFVCALVLQIMHRFWVAYVLLVFRMEFIVSIVSYLSHSHDMRLLSHKHQVHNKSKPIKYNRIFSDCENTVSMLSCSQTI